jgi:ATP-dependent Clp protease ATP-binding subunit ClpA
MTKLSYAVEFAWQVAGDEVVTAGSDLIEPEHLMIGLCSVEKLFSTDLAKRKRLTEYFMASVRVEWQELSRIFAAAKVTPSALRRDLRAALPAGPHPPGAKRKASRSKRSHAIFTRAGKKAEAAGSAVVGATHFLAALIEDDYAGWPPHVAETLARMKKDVDAAAGKPLIPQHDSSEQLSYLSEVPIAEETPRRKK